MTLQWYDYEHVKGSRRSENQNEFYSPKRFFPVSHFSVRLTEVTFKLLLIPDKLLDKVRT